MPILTIIDVTGTQNYIFGTNKLRENIGASEVVAQATSYWIFDILKAAFPNQTNLFQDEKKPSKKPSFETIDETKKIGDNGIIVEVIYAGGGNALILFDKIESARKFAQSYTKDLLENAPNLEVVLTHSDKSFDLDEIEEKTGEFDGPDEPITEKKKVPSILKIVQDTFRQLNQKKQNRTVSAPLQGLAVSAQCVSTGGVASKNPLDLATEGSNYYDVLLDKYKRNYISSEAFAKIKTAKKANDRLKDEIFNASILKGLEIPRELDHLGRTEGEASYIAVVHTDGNRMGKRITDFGKTATDNRDWIDKMRSLSKSIHETNLDVLKETLKVLSNHIKNDAFTASNGETFELTKVKNKNGNIKTYFPMRPLIFGGDDLTFICDARISLAFTALYLKELLKKENEKFKYKLEDGEPLYARAGIAIVKSHYPFSRAYDLAEELGKSAKELINKIDDNEKKVDDNEKKVAAIDWHVAMSGLLGNLEEIRKREYFVWLEEGGERIEGNLNMRPLALLTPDKWQTYEVFESIVKEFQGKNDKGDYHWKDKRNKIKAFRDVLRGGKKQVEKFLTLYKLIEKKTDGTFESKMPKVPNASAIEKEGWQDNKCGYFDAIEMLDLFYPMNENITTEDSEAISE